MDRTSGAGTGAAESMVVPLAAALASAEALAGPLERGGVGVPAAGGGFEPGDDVVRGGGGLAGQCAADEDALDRLTEPKMIHVLSLVLQRITIPARVPVACSRSLPPDTGLRPGLSSPG